MAYYQISIYEICILAVINICIISFMYITLRRLMNKKVHNQLKSLLNTMDLMSKDLSENNALVIANEEYQEYYEKIETLRKQLYTKDQTRQKVLQIINSIYSNIELEKMLEQSLPKLSSLTKSDCIAFYMFNRATNKLEIKCSVGFSKDIYSEFDIDFGEGFIGSAILNMREVKVLDNIPDDSVYVMRTFLGTIKPKQVVVAPITYEGEMSGTLLLASIREYTEDQIEIITLVKDSIGVAVGNSIAFEKIKKLSNELKFQNRLIQDLNEELEKKVQERTVFLKDMIDSVYDIAIYAMDVNGIILEWNKGAENILGIKVEEAKGNHVNILYTEREIMNGVQERRLNTLNAEGKLKENGWRFKKDGTPYFSDMTSYVQRNSDGQITGYTNIVRDITSDKTLVNALLFEKDFALKLLDRSSQAVLLCDKNCTIMIINKLVESVLNTSNLIGKPLDYFFVESEEVKENILISSQTSKRIEMKCRLISKNEDVNITIISNDNEYGKKIVVYLFY